jgi:hypothetical protein
MDSVPGAAAYQPIDIAEREAKALGATASGKPKKRFVGKARRQQQQAEGSMDPTIEESAVAIRDGNCTSSMEKYSSTHGSSHVERRIHQKSIVLIREAYTLSSSAGK